jgi:MFS family permease
MLLLSLADNLVLVYASGIVAAFGLGWLFAPVSTIITNWFIDKRSAMIGLVFSGSGFGGALVVPVAGYLITTLGWRAAYQCLAAAMLIISIPCLIFLIKNRPESFGQRPLGYNKAKSEAEQRDVGQAAEGVDAKTAIRTPSYWLLFVGIACSGFLLTGVIVSLPTFWAGLGMDTITASNWMGLFFILGAAGIVIAGTLSGKLGTRFYIIYSIIAFVAGMAIILTSTVATAPVLLALVLLGLAYPLLSVTPPLTTVEAFGKKDYDRLIGPFQGVIQMGAGISVLLIGVIADATGSFIPGFTVLLIMAAISLVLIMLGLRLAPLSKARRGTR